MPSFIQLTTDTSLHFLPLPVQSLGRYFQGSAQFLGEERDSKLFEHPAIVYEMWIVLGLCSHAVRELLHSRNVRLECFREAEVALGMAGAALFNSQGDPAEVTWHVLQPLPGRFDKELFRQKLRQLTGDIGLACFAKYGSSAPKLLGDFFVRLKHRSDDAQRLLDGHGDPLAGPRLDGGEFRGRSRQDIHFGERPLGNDLDELFLERFLPPQRLGELFEPVEIGQPIDVIGQLTAAGHNE